MDSIGTIQVQVAALESAASIIANASIEADLAAGQIRSAGGSAGAFGGEPAGDAFTSACTRGASAVSSIADALEQLAVNTAAAAEGYVITDQGAIPTSFGLFDVKRLKQGGP